PHPARHTKSDRTAAHRKLDRRRDDLCDGGLRKCASLIASASDIQLQSLNTCDGNTIFTNRAKNICHSTLRECSKAELCPMEREDERFCRVVRSGRTVCDPAK